MSDGSSIKANVDAIRAQAQREDHPDGIGAPSPRLGARMAELALFEGLLYDIRRIADALDSLANRHGSER